MPNYIRKTAIEAVVKLLKNLPEHEDHPLDAIRMIDRSIGGLLAHAESPSYLGFRDYTSILFPSGLEATIPGQDIILILNKAEVTIIKDGKERIIKIPSALKNPEKGVAQIIGHHLAERLFIARERVLAELIACEINDANWKENATPIANARVNIKKHSSWIENAIAHDAAWEVLKHYRPYQSIPKELFSSYELYSMRLFPSIRAHEEEKDKRNILTGGPSV